MIHPRHAVAGRLSILAIALSLALPASGWGWGFPTHHYIAQNYSKHLPAAIDGLRAYDSVVDLHVTDPDTRRPSTPGEAPRHFIDIDYYPEFHAGTLSHDRAVLSAQYGATTVTNLGIVPWAVGEVVTTLTNQFQAGNWSAAALTIADLCHYVGDAAQPMHCTQNYDGQMTGQHGLHSRYESTMMSSRIGLLVTPVTPVTFYPNTVDAMFDIVQDSWDGLATVLQADLTAKAAAGGSTSGSVYYNSLWANTETLTRSRINVAAVGTASFVYKAWIAAGQPPVPGSSAGVPPNPVAGTRLDAGPSPFRDALTIHFAGNAPVTIDVYDVRGARVERVVDRISGAGTVSWRPGRDVVPGLYFVHLSGPTSIVRRVTRIE